MYRDEILDHYRNPRNTGELETENHAHGLNESCGDETRVYLEIGDEGTIKQMKHETDGCAISTASTSILSRELQGMKKEKAKQLDRNWMLETLGIDVSPMRVKCAVLGLKTMQEALEK